MKKVLIIEDDFDIKNILDKHLSSMSIKVIAASNGIEALEIIDNEGMPDLIISDIKMPVMDGIEFSDTLFKKYERNVAPLIFLTERRTVENIIDGFKHGAVRYVTKPFQIGRLVRIINCLLYSTDKPVIELVEHYENFITFKITNNIECLKEIGYLITEIISGLKDISKNEKYRILDSVNNIILNISNCHESIDDKETVRDITINYYYQNTTITLLIETSDNATLEKLKKYIENFFIDFIITLKNGYLKISKNIME